jgi:protein-S-isoprenylcysteine O-methyltransferase Ste14
VLAASILLDIAAALVTLLAFAALFVAAWALLGVRRASAELERLLRELGGRD